MQGQCLAHMQGRCTTCLKVRCGRCAGIRCWHQVPACHPHCTLRHVVHRSRMWIGHCQVLAGLMPAPPPRFWTPTWCHVPAARLWPGPCPNACCLLHSSAEGQCGCCRCGPPWAGPHVSLCPPANGLHATSWLTVPPPAHLKLHLTALCTCHRLGAVIPCRLSSPCCLQQRVSASCTHPDSKWAQECWHQAVLPDVKMLASSTMRPVHSSHSIY